MFTCTILHITPVLYSTQYITPVLTILYTHIYYILHKRRQTSLDREVYYDSDNVRKEVVTYKPVENAKLGGLSDKYKLSNEVTNQRPSF